MAERNGTIDRGVPPDDLHNEVQCLANPTVHIAVAELAAVKPVMKQAEAVCVIGLITGVISD